MRRDKKSSPTLQEGGVKKYFTVNQYFTQKNAFPLKYNNSIEPELK